MQTIFVTIGTIGKTAEIQINSDKIQIKYRGNNFVKSLNILTVTLYYTRHQIFGLWALQEIKYMKKV